MKDCVSQCWKQRTVTGIERDGAKSPGDQGLQKGEDEMEWEAKGWG